MYYYKIMVYEPYDGHKEMIVSHKDELDDLEFHSKIQGVIDNTIADYVNRMKGKDKKPCHWRYWGLIASNNGYRFNSFLSKAGFEIIYPRQKVSIENRVILSDDRYEKLFILDKCKDCYRDVWDDKCPIVCKRI